MNKLSLNGYSSAEDLYMDHLEDASSTQTISILFKWKIFEFFIAQHTAERRINLYFIRIVAIFYHIIVGFSCIEAQSLRGFFGQNIDSVREVLKWVLLAVFCLQLPFLAYCVYKYQPGGVIGASVENSIYMTIAFTYIVYPLMIATFLYDAKLMIDSWVMIFLKTVALIIGASFIAFNLRFRNDLLCQSRLAMNDLTSELVSYMLTSAAQIICSFKGHPGMFIDHTYTALSLTSSGLLLIAVAYVGFNYSFWHLSMNTLYTTWQGRALLFKIIVELGNKGLGGHELILFFVLQMFIPKLSLMVALRRLKVNVFDSSISINRRCFGISIMCRILRPDSSREMSMIDQDVFLFYSGLVENHLSLINFEYSDMETSWHPKLLNRMIRYVSKFSWKEPNILKLLIQLQVIHLVPYMKTIRVSLRALEKVNQGWFFGSFDTYHLQRLIECKLDALYKGKIKDNDPVYNTVGMIFESISLGNETMKDGGMGALDLGRPFTAMSRYNSIATSIEFLYATQLSIYEDLTMSNRRKSKVLFTYNKQTFRYRNKINFAIKRLQRNHPEETNYFSFFYPMLIFYYSLITYELKTASKMLTLYKSKLLRLYHVLNSKFALTNLRIETDAVTLQICLEEGNVGKITKVSNNYFEYLGDPGNADILGMNINDFLPPKISENHALMMANLHNFYRMNLYLDNYMTDFDGNLIAMNSCIKMQPSLEDFASALGLLIFKHNRKGSFMMVDQDLNILGADYMVQKLMKKAGIPFEPMKYNLKNLFENLADCITLFRALKEEEDLSDKGLKSLKKSNSLKESLKDAIKPVEFCNESSGVVYKVQRSSLLYLFLRKKSIKAKFEICKSVQLPVVRIYIEFGEDDRSENRSKRSHIFRENSLNNSQHSGSSEARSDKTQDHRRNRRRCSQLERFSDRAEYDSLASSNGFELDDNFNVGPQGKKMWFQSNRFEALIMPALEVADSLFRARGEIDKMQVNNANTIDSDKTSAGGFDSPNLIQAVKVVSVLKTRFLNISANYLRDYSSQKQSSEVMFMSSAGTPPSRKHLNGFKFVSRRSDRKDETSRRSEGPRSLTEISSKFKLNPHPVEPLPVSSTNLLGSEKSKKHKNLSPQKDIKIKINRDHHEESNLIPSKFDTMSPVHKTLSTGLLKTNLHDLKTHEELRRVNLATGRTIPKLLDRIAKRDIVKKKVGVTGSETSVASVDSQFGGNIKSRQIACKVRTPPVSMLKKVLWLISLLFLAVLGTTVLFIKKTQISFLDTTHTYFKIEKKFTLLEQSYRLLFHSYLDRRYSIGSLFYAQLWPEMLTDPAKKALQKARSQAQSLSTKTIGQFSHIGPFLGVALEFGFLERNLLENLRDTTSSKELGKLNMGMQYLLISKSMPFKVYEGISETVLKTINTTFTFYTLSLAQMAIFFSDLMLKISHFHVFSDGMYKVPGKFLQEEYLGSIEDFFNLLRNTYDWFLNYGPNVQSKIRKFLVEVEYANFNKKFILLFCLNNFFFLCVLGAIVFFALRINRKCYELLVMIQHLKAEELESIKDTLSYRLRYIMEWKNDEGRILSIALNPSKQKIHSEDPTPSHKKDRRISGSKPAFKKPYKAGLSQIPHNFRFYSSSEALMLLIFCFILVAGHFGFIYYESSHLVRITQIVEFNSKTTQLFNKVSNFYLHHSLYLMFGNFIKIEGKYPSEILPPRRLGRSPIDEIIEFYSRNLGEMEKHYGKEKGQVIHDIMFKNVCLSLEKDSPTFQNDSMFCKSAGTLEKGFMDFMNTERKYFLEVRTAIGQEKEYLESSKTNYKEYKFQEQLTSVKSIFFRLSHKLAFDNTMRYLVEAGEERILKELDKVKFNLTFFGQWLFLFLGLFFVVVFWTMTIRSLKKDLRFSCESLVNIIPEYIANNQMIFANYKRIFKTI